MDNTSAPRLFSNAMGRRAVLGIGAMALAGCVTDDGPAGQLLQTNDVRSESPIPAMYRAASDGGFQIPEVDVGQVDTRFWRRVDYGADERVGTLIVDTPAKYLYHVVSRGRATRCGMGVGRDGFEWSGRANVAYTRPWPRWVPPDSMIRRQPELTKYNAAVGGMPSGIQNPLGARFVYF
jgi:lipoprotein-anchoring transpeptidase ErfK/SrfK